MAYFGSTSYGVKTTGNKVTVPDNPISKLKYYLNCVLGLLNVDKQGILGKVQNFESSKMGNDEFQILVALCAKLQPKVFLNKCLFVSPELCPDSNNEFYQIDQVKNILAVGQGVIIGGVNRNVVKIMACKMSWLETNYYNPLKLIATLYGAAESERVRREKGSKKE